MPKCKAQHAESILEQSRLPVYWILLLLFLLDWKTSTPGLQTYRGEVLRDTRSSLGGLSHGVSISIKILKIWCPKKQKSRWHYADTLRSVLSKSACENAHDTCSHRTEFITLGSPIYWNSRALEIPWESDQNLTIFQWRVYKRTSGVVWKMHANRCRHILVRKICTSIVLHDTACEHKIRDIIIQQI